MRKGIGSALGLALALAAAPAAAQPVDGAVAAASFDTAWSVIERTHWDTTYNGVDWDSVGRALRPRAAAARTGAELRAVLTQMLGTLRQSHFYVIPGEAQEALETDGAAGDGDAGMKARLVDGRLLVSHVEPGGAAEAAGVRPGWEVERLGALDAARVLRTLADLPGGTEGSAAALQLQQAVAGALAGPEGAPLEAVFRDAEGRRAALSLVRRAPAGTVTRYGNLTVRLRADSRRVALGGGKTAGVIRFNFWFPLLARQVDLAVDEFRDADGIVVDLRGNAGGVGIMAAGVAGHFVDRPDTLGSWHMRDQTLHYVVNPRRVDTQARPVAPYAGPVAVLTDAQTASTSEFFAAGLQALGRAKVFGERTAGQALPSFARKLPSGDVLVHAMGDFTGPGGRRMEGEGVAPDVNAPPTRASLLRGEDPALEAALAWIREQAGES